MATLSSMHSAGAAILTQLLKWSVPAAGQRSLPCKCGHLAHYRELRSKEILAVVGKVQVLRPYYLCSHCHDGQFPVDVELDVKGKDLSPGVRRMLATLGQDAPFAHGPKLMKALAGLEVTTKAVERTAEEIGEDIAAVEQEQIQLAMKLKLQPAKGEPIPIMYLMMDGTGAPVRKSETVGRPSKTPGRQARTREVKLGCVFTQTTYNSEGYAIRDPGSTTYAAAIETSEEFGPRMYLESWNRGWSRAQTKIIIGDGAGWIWNLADQYFPGAILIVDLYHAREHLWDLARKLYPNQEPEQKRWIMIHQYLLDHGKPKKLVTALEAIALSSPLLARDFHKEADFFRKNAKRMRYPKFRRLHLFVGSGVVEAGCRTIVGARCKQPGMFWTVRGVNAILALRCCQLNGRFETYWEARNERAA